MSYRDPSPTQTDIDVMRAAEEVLIIHKAGSRIEKHRDVMAATSTAKFQFYPGGI
ncbi:hypothetical protein PC116_g33043 [Phytophthora cactorum]|nr:hypothetical protein PC116_g33043 [Phytophthora cactorum]